MPRDSGTKETAEETFDKARLRVQGEQGKETASKKREKSGARWGARKGKNKAAEQAFSTSSTQDTANTGKRGGTSDIKTEGTNETIGKNA